MLFLSFFILLFLILCVSRLHMYINWSVKFHENRNFHFTFSSWYPLPKNNHFDLFQLIFLIFNSMSLNNMHLFPPLNFSVFSIICFPTIRYKGSTLFPSLHLAPAHIYAFPIPPSSQGSYNLGEINIYYLYNCDYVNAIHSWALW